MKEHHCLIALAVVAILLIILLYLVVTKKDSPFQATAPPRSKYRGFADAQSDWDPPKIIDSVLTEDECRYIIDKATPKFTRSMVVGGGGQPNAVRTSDTAWLEHDDPVVNKVIKKAAELTGVATSNIEHLQVVRYKPGTFYKEHHDSCCDPTDSCLDFEKRGGQRIGTLLVYLNSDFTDGETHFPKWNGGVKLKADPGSAIFFRPMATNSAQCHPQALHAGLPISTGIKYVCNAWVRERPI